MLSSAGEVICVVDWPNRPELAGVLVVCCAPNPPKDGAGAVVGVDWFPVPPALNPPKLESLVPGWELPPKDVFTEKGLLAGGDPKEVGPAPKLNETAPPVWQLVPDENIPPDAPPEFAPGKL